MRRTVIQFLPKSIRCPEAHSTDMQIVEIRQLIKEIVLHTNSGRWKYGGEPCCSHRHISKKRHEKNRVQLTVANTESKPAAARIICNCPRLMFGRLMIEYSIWNDVFKQSVPNAASKRSCPLRTASSL